MPSARDGASRERAIATERARGRWGYVEGEKVIGCVGIEARSPSAARIRGVAVDARCRGLGFGRSLLLEASARLQGLRLVAETDSEGVGFYRSCGFAVKSLGEKYPGVERFECTLPAGGVLFSSYAG
jgi:ribosomal protein S18 acetylase RimI-like enzyme